MEMIQDSDYTKALFYVDRILEIDPYNQNALNNKGGILLQTGNYSEAISNFDRILLVNENNTEALNNKAIALANQVQYTEALKLFYKSFQLDSSNKITEQNIRNLIDKLYFLDESKNSFGVVILRDQNGSILSYSKVSQIVIQPPLGYIHLKNTGTFKEIIINNEKHEILQVTGTIPVSENMFVGTTKLILLIDGKQFPVAELIFHGFIATVGNQIEYDVVILDPSY